MQSTPVSVIEQPAQCCSKGECRNKTISYQASEQHSSCYPSCYQLRGVYMSPKSLPSCCSSPFTDLPTVPYAVICLHLHLEHTHTLYHYNRNKVDVSKLTPAEQQAFRLYGKLPSRPVAKSQERKYFGESSSSVFSGSSAFQ